MSEDAGTPEAVDGARATLRSPHPADAARLDRARVQASARAKLFRRTAPDQRLGRYVLAEVLGAGGAGKVYAAHDPKLDRRVALKLVGHAGADHDARLIREARALARLSHPNIVHVYDVGSDAFEGAPMLYIAMELVEGETLRSWMRTKRSTPAIVAMFREIARGLAAAHDAALIHRDFKPENVLIGRDGRPRVADFGLVRQPGADDPLVITQSDGEPPEHLLTRTGALMGTPAYMAPEQFAGAKVDARVDQFAFCVALFEALHGERPFQGATLRELAANVGEGTQIRPRQPRKLGPRLRRLLERGLAVDAAQRFASMRDVIAELDERGRNRGAIAVAMCGVAALPIGLWSVREQPCAGAEEGLAGVWDDDTRASLRTAILGTGTDFAPRVADTTEAALDRWADTWRASNLSACTATKIDGDQSERMMDLRQGCLRLRRAEAASVLAVIRDGDARTLARATELAMGLRTPAICDRTEALDTGVEPPDPAHAAEVEGHRAALAQARALEQSGDREAARRITQDVLDRARALDYRPLVAEAEVALAIVTLALGDVDGSETLATTAFQDAIAADHATMIAFAANHMVQVLAAARRKPELAEPWLGHAKAATERIHDDGAAEMLLLQREGVLRFRQNRIDEAVDAMRRSCTLGEGVYGEMSLDVLRCWTNTAVAEDARGNNDEAQALADRVLAARRDLLGPDHPDLGYVYNALGTIANDRNDKALSLAHYREAARVFEHGFGSEHPDLAGALYNVGNRLRESGDDEAARVEYLRALAIFEKALGPNGQMTGQTLNSTALTLQNQGRLDEAMRYYRRAVEVFAELPGKGVEGGVVAHNNIGNILLELRRPTEAIAEYERAMATADAQLAPTHRMYTHALTGIGDAWMQLDQPARAIEPLQRAVELREKIDHPETSKARWVLARALWLADRRDDARVQLGVLVEQQATEAEQAARWLASDVMP